MTASVTVQSVAATRGRTTQARRATLVGLFGVMAAAMLFTAWLVPSMPAVAAARPAGLHLTVSPQHPTYRPGGSVVLRVTIQNAGPAPCALESAPYGSLDVLGASRDGTPLQPVYAQMSPLEGSADLVTDYVTTVGPGRSASFMLDSDAVPSPSGGTPAIAMPTPLRDQSSIETMWPTGATGRYRFDLVYQVPPLVGNNACAGRSDIAVVSFAVGQPRAGRGVWIIAAVAVLLGVTGVVTWRARRRRSARRAGVPRSVAMLAVILVAAALGASLTGVRPAGAEVNFAPNGIGGAGGSASDQQGEYDSCAAMISRFDPTFFAGFNTGLVTVTTTTGPNHTTSKFPDSIVYWNNRERSPFKDDPQVTIDPCAALFHELVHAREAAQETQSQESCAETNGLAITEVDATRAENSFRLANGLLPRHSYGPTPLPAAATCPTLLQKLGLSNGDPHLRTIDGARYDFQAVGEFTAVASSAGDLVIQVRQTALGQSKSVAVNTAVAIQTPGTRLGFYLADGTIEVHRDRTVLTPPLGDTSLPRGATLTRTPDAYAGDTYAVRWPDGTQAGIRRAGPYGLVLTVDPAVSRAGTLSGLLGNDDGDPTNDIAPRDGRPVTPSFEHLYPSLADSWRVASATSLFDYGPGQTTATFTDRAFPTQPATADALTPAQRDAAQEACALTGVSDPVDVADCLLDVALTGSADFAIAAGDLEAAARSGPAAAAAPSPTSSGDTHTAQLGVTKGAPIAHTSFSATKGERVQVDVLTTTLPYQCGPITLRGPDDNVLEVGCTGVGTAIDGLLLPVTGIYNVYVDPEGGAAGQITLRVVTSVDQVQASSIDAAPVIASVDTAGGQSRVTFSAASGQKVFVAADHATFPDQCGALALLGPGGNPLVLGCLTGGAGFIDGTVLPVSGSYAVLVNPAGDATGSINLRVIGDEDETTQTTIGAPPVVATVGQPGASAEVSFHGVTQQRVEATFSASTFPDQCGLVALVAPSGSIMTTGCVTNGHGSIPALTLPADGTYTLVVDPGGVATGMLKIAVSSA